MRLSRQAMRVCCTVVSPQQGAGRQVQQHSRAVARRGCCKAGVEAAWPTRLLPHAATLNSHNQTVTIC